MKRSVLALLVAAVLAVIGCAAVFLYVSGADARAVEGKNPVHVLVAAKRIPAGTTGSQLRDGDYTVLEVMPKSAVPSDALSSIERSLDSLALTSDVQPRQLLLRGAFGEPVALGGGLRIPEGKVAISVPIVNGAGAGYIQPGSKIAIFDTFTLLEGKNGVPAGDGLSREHPYNQATRLLLAKVDVIAVGLPGQEGAQTTADRAKPSAAPAKDEESSDKQSAGSVVVVTVAVSQAEAERLIHAAQTGTLYMALLDESSDVQPGPGVNNDSLFS